MPTWSKVALAAAAGGVAAYLIAPGAGLSTFRKYGVPLTVVAIGAGLLVEHVFENMLGAP